MDTKTNADEINTSADVIDLSNVIHGSNAVHAACSPGDIDDCGPDRSACTPDW